ncbi:MAG: hypothetical protein K6C40_09545 [Thermoguttaceae bacterium]|nr:hypothetical protein [Thermoguttaceae bacterium]
MTETDIRTIQQQIDITLMKRQEFAKKPKKMVDLLTILESNIRDFVNQVLLKLVAKTDGKRQMELQSLINDLGEFINRNRIGTVRTRLDEIRQRFERNTLCVGLVGMHGQGKSKFLQGITGLGDTIIPTGARGDMTGAQMIFHNDSETHAKLQFYTEEEFLEYVVSPIFKAIDLVSPNSIWDFLNYSNEQLEQKRERAKELVSTIDNLRKAYPSYKNLLKGGSKEIDCEDIQEWTSKHDEEDRPLYKWMAVKLANIYCPFPNMEGLHISVVDTPGMGDSYVPNEGSKLRENFTLNVDDVCFFRRILQRGLGEQDDRLYTTAHEALPELNVKDWSHFLVNVFESEKDDITAQQMLATLRKGFEDPNRRFYGMQDRYHEIYVCKGNPPETNRDNVISLFSIIVSDMAQNQEKLDDLLFKNRTEKVYELVRSLEDILTKAARLIPKGDGILSGLEFDERFKDYFTKIYAGLKRLVAEKRQKRDEYDEELSDLIDNLVKEVTEEVKQDLSSLKEDDIGDQHLFAHDRFHKLRVMLATKFDILDINLDKGMKEIHERLTSILCEQGGLGHLFADEKLQPKEYLLKLARKFEEIEGCDKLANVLQKHLATSLSFRMYLLPQVRSTLDPIDYDSEEAPEIRPGVSWEENKQAIIKAFAVAAFDCAEKLKKITSKKNQAIFAVVDQLKDGLIYTDGYIHCQNMWKELYRQNQESIWIEEGQEAKVKRELRHQWEDKARTIRDTLRQLIEK